MWRAWKKSPAVKENPELIDEVRRQIEKNGNENQDIQFPDFDGEEFVNESGGQGVELRDNMPPDEVQ